MGSKGKWAKACGHNKGESCYNCAHKQSIADGKLWVMVTCSPEWAKEL